MGLIGFQKVDLSEENYMFLLSLLNFCKYQLQNKLVLGVTNLAQMDQKLGGKLLVQKILPWNEHALKCPELCYWIHHVE